MITRIRRKSTLSGYLLILIISAAVPAVTSAADVPVRIPPQTAQDRARDVASSVRAQSPDAAPAEATGASREEIRAWADSFFAVQLDSLGVPGAVFVVADSTGILFASGYGVADIATGRPVDVDSTIFQVASVSKLFTATAVMQLAQSRHVDLQADVTGTVPGLTFNDEFEQPVTLHQLLTHTAGFDERNIGYMARDAESVRPLRDYLLDRMPPRTIEPGTVTSYSNHGFGFAGLVVEEVSGMSFEEYQERHILRPLGMETSTFRSPLPDELSGRLAKGYRMTSDGPQEAPVLYRNVLPAGALSASGADMGRFMAAHLAKGAGGADGANESAPILERATARLMHRQQFTNHPALPGMAYGFMEQVENGRRAIQHGGEIPGYGSLLFLLPEEGVGFFMSSNMLSNTLRERLVERFMDRFYPAVARTADAASGSAGSPEGTAAHAGTYRLNRYARKSIEKMPGVFSNEYHVWASGDTLVTQDGRRWLEIEPFVYRHTQGEDLMAFRTDDTGRVTHMFRDLQLGGAVPGAYERLDLHETGTFLNEFYLSWVPFLLLTWIIWPVGALVGWGWRKWKGRPGPRRPPAMVAARAAVVIASIAMLWFVFGFVQPLARAASQGGGEWFYGIPDSAARLMWLPWAHMVLTPVIAGSLVAAWRHRWWSLPGRIHYTVILLAAGAWLAFLWQYNMLG